MNHPEIDWIERTGYPSWMQGNGRFDQDDYDDYCEELYQQKVDKERFDE